MSNRGPRRSHRRLLRSGISLVAASSLMFAAAACGKNDTAPASFRLDSMPNTTMRTQGLVRAGHPQAFNFERIGCVATQRDLSVDSITLHSPTSGLTLTDWGARATAAHAPAAIDWGIFSPAQHPLGKLGLGKAVWTGHCGKAAEQLVVVAQLNPGSTGGAAAGVDVHFSDGTTTWVPIGIGVCVHQCTSALINPTIAAINAQRAAVAA